MPHEISYDARVYRTAVYKGSQVTTYKVRWKVGGRLWKEGFRTVAQADSFRSALLTRCTKGRSIQRRDGQADSLGAQQGGHRLVSVRLPVRRREVEAGLG